MKKTVISFVVFLLLSSCSSAVRVNIDPLDYVNVLVGTNSNPAFSHGNTYPAITRPWGMNVWCAQTGLGNDPWVYTWQSDSIRGFRQTHVPSPWIGDYGFFTLMPVAGALKTDERERSCAFYHCDEKATPYYYSVGLHDYDIITEITATERCGYLRFNYNSDNGDRYIVLDVPGRDSRISIDPAAGKITGCAANSNGGTPAGFSNWFVIYFDCEFTEYGTWNSEGVTAGKTDSSQRHDGIFVKFPAGTKIVTARVASSYISTQQAELNLRTETGDMDFDALCAENKRVWTEHLGRITVEGGTEEQKRMFYSNLYRVSLYPRQFFEYREDGTPYHFSPFDGKIHDGYMFTDNGFWDTFRSAHPFYTLVYPELTEKLMPALINIYEQGGWLPNWISPGYRNSMIGTHAISLLNDAYSKGITGFDTDLAMEAVIKESTTRGPSTYIGRYGFAEYNAKGYIPYPEYPQAVAMTLEYCYDDFCAMRFAEQTGKPELATQFAQRALNYRNVYDASTGFMRPRVADGGWFTPFDPYRWGGPYTEGNAVQYSWSVFHDVEGLKELMGGKDAFVAKLDSVFTRPPIWSLYDRGFNEIAEMHRAGFGQYAHGNQPAQHIIYLYSYVGEPWKTQYWSRKIMDCLYNSTHNGYAGDEDNGQTSSWFLFSAMGFYPVCPGTGEYILGSPLFGKITLALPGGKTFTVEAPGNDEKNRYVGGTQLNGEPYGKLFLRHEDITAGGFLTFSMSDKPIRNRKFEDRDFPYSLSDEFKKMNKNE